MHMLLFKQKGVAVSGEAGSTWPPSNPLLPAFHRALLVAVALMPNGRCSEQSVGPADSPLAAKSRVVAGLPPCHAGRRVDPLLRSRCSPQSAGLNDLPPHRNSQASAVFVSGGETKVEEAALAACSDFFFQGFFSKDFFSGPFEPNLRRKI
jgi:hypothetical protein